MKTSPLLLSALLLFGISIQNSSAAGNSYLDINFSSADGGSNTQISWTFSGLLVSNYQASSGPFADIIIPGMGAINTGYYTNLTSFSVSGAGSFTNLTTPASAQIGYINLLNTNGVGNVYLSFSSDNTTTFSVFDDHIQYISGTDSYIINTPYAAFNPGVYTYTNPVITGNGIRETLTIAAVPEPSAYVFFGLVALVLVIASRRRAA